MIAVSRSPPGHSEDAANALLTAGNNAGSLNVGGFRLVPSFATASKGLNEKLVSLFPPHVFTWHRTHGQTTVKLGTRHQVMAIGSAVLVAGWLGIATTSMVSGNQSADSALMAKQAELSRLQTQLTAMKTNVAAVEGSVADTAKKLETRQAFLASLLGGKRDLKALAAMLPRQTGNDLAAARDLLAPKNAKVLEPFRQIESQQLAFVDKATDAAEARMKDTQSLIRRLGLDPSRFVTASDFSNGGAMGGPYVPVAADAEPRFKDLFVSWKKLATLQAAVTAIPSYMPVKAFSYTSGFGVRYDPFNGGAAMHAGVDMAGSMGESIYAAANGTVGKAGVASGYGNLIELEHGKGIATRYGHLSAILVHAGDSVKQGQLIGRMGSTGRSTGTHLHYEIRIDGRAVNPRPYLEASAFMLAAQAQGPQLNGGEPETFSIQQAKFEPVADDVTVTASSNMTPIRSYR